ncbi:hypothetical protein Bca101_024657 [Brassica carinata]
MHKKSKHFEVNFHFVREKVALGKLIVHHIPGLLQLADIFTKSLATQNFQALRFKLGVVCSPTQSLRGHVDRSDKDKKIWKPKETTVSETCSVSETEKKNETMDLSDKLEMVMTPRAETSFTKHGMGQHGREPKPIQIQKPATAILSLENKNRVKDKDCGPALYGLQEPITLKNSFQLLESKEETKT